MSDPSTLDENVMRTSANAHVVHSMMRFLRIMRYRKGIVIACVTVSLLLSALYYATATRLYESKAGILVMQTGSDMTSTRITPEGARQGLMPTYERILLSSEVLEGAVGNLPREHCIDLHEVSQEKWAWAIRNNLSVKTVRNSNVIEVTYRSRSPEAAAAVVQAIVDSYLTFMNRTNEGAATEILGVLNEEKSKANRQLERIQQEVLQAKQQILDVGSRDENGTLHPVVKRAMVLNEALIEITKRRLALQASLASIQASVRNGGNLNQHMLSLEGEIGRELLMASLGIGSQETANRVELEQDLLRDQGALETLREAYGDNHPEIRKILNRMAVTQKYLQSHQQRVQAQLALMQTEQLGPMLTKIVEQRLTETMRHESGLAASYQQARAQAIQLIGSTRRLEILEEDERYLRRERDGLLEKVAQIGLTQDQGNIRTAVTDPPKIMRSHVWPKLPLVGLFSLVGGIAISVGIVSVMDVLDDRFRSPEEMQEQLGLPVLAIVRKLTSFAETGVDALQMNVAPDTPESESFRTLRTTIAFSSEETGRLVISSTEPGDGKTTVVSNLAVACSRAGKRTLLIDADMRRPGLTRLLNFRGKSGLTQVLQSDQPAGALAKSLIQPSGVERLDLLPSGPRQANPAELLAGPRLPELLAWAESVYDQVLIDAPPAVAAADASIIGAITDGLILVVQPDKNRRHAVVRAVEGFRSVGVQPLGVVVNGQNGDATGYYSYTDGYGYGAENESQDVWTEEATSESAAYPTNQPDAEPIVPRRAA